MEGGFFENASTLLRAMIGAVGALALIVFIAGFGTYATRIGTERREEGLHTMRAAVGLVLTSIVLIYILRFFTAVQG